MDRAARNDLTVPSPNEALFERTICDWLQKSGGYVAMKNDKAQGAQSDFDRTRNGTRYALDEFDVLSVEDAVT